MCSGEIFYTIFLLFLSPFLYFFSFSSFPFFSFYFFFFSFSFLSLSFSLLSFFFFWLQRRLGMPGSEPACGHTCACILLILRFSSRRPRLLVCLSLSLSRFPELCGWLDCENHFSVFVRKKVLWGAQRAIQSWDSLTRPVTTLGLFQIKGCPPGPCRGGGRRGCRRTLAGRFWLPSSSP